MGTHERESATPQEDGTILADCSCGATYTVPQSNDEYTALEAARATHTEEAAAIAGLQWLAKRWPPSLRLISMDGALHVIHTDDPRFDGENDNLTRQEAILADIPGIPNEGGAW